MSTSRSASNSTIADAAMDLINELYNNPDIIPPYNEESLKRCADKITDLYNSNFNILLGMSSSGSAGENSIIVVKAQQVGIDRIKQCCYAYLNERIQRLKQMRWRSGGVLSPGIRANLSKEELKWWKTYNQIIFKFQSSIGENGVDLFNHVHPPKSLLVHVRAVKDYGEFETTDGTSILFTKNSMHYLPRQDCENLIRKGILEYVN